MDERSWSALQDNYLELWPEEAWSMEGKERNLMFGQTTGMWQTLIRAVQRFQTVWDDVDSEEDFARSIFDKVEFLQDSYISFDAFWEEIWILPHDKDVFVRAEVKEKEYERWLDLNDRFANLCRADNVRIACVKHLKKAIGNAMKTIRAHRPLEEPEAESEEAKEKKELDDDLDAYRRRKRRFESEPKYRGQPEPEQESEPKPDSEPEQQDPEPKPELELEPAPQSLEQLTVEQHMDQEMESEPEVEPEPELAAQPVEELTNAQRIMQRIRRNAQESEEEKAKFYAEIRRRREDSADSAILDTGQSRQ